MKVATLCYIRKDGKTLMLHKNKHEEGELKKEFKDKTFRYTSTK